MCKSTTWWGKVVYSVGVVGDSGILNRKAEYTERSYVGNPLESLH